MNRLVRLAGTGGTEATHVGRLPKDPAAMCLEGIVPPVPVPVWPAGAMTASHLSHRRSRQPP